MRGLLQQYTAQRGITTIQSATTVCSGTFGLSVYARDSSLVVSRPADSLTPLAQRRRPRYPQSQTSIAVNRDSLLDQRCPTSVERRPLSRRTRMHHNHRAGTCPVCLLDDTYELRVTRVVARHQHERMIAPSGGSLAKRLERTIHRSRVRGKLERHLNELEPLLE